MSFILPGKTRAVRRRGGRLARCHGDGTKDSRAANRLEELLPPCEHVVERVLEVRRRFGELAPDLLDVFFVALLNLFAEELFQGAVADPLFALAGKVGDDVGYERSSQPLGLCVRIIRQERIDRRAGWGRTAPWGAGQPRGGGGGRWGGRWGTHRGQGPGLGRPPRPGPAQRRRRERGP